MTNQSLLWSDFIVKTGICDVLRSLSSVCLQYAAFPGLYHVESENTPQNVSVTLKNGFNTVPVLPNSKGTRTF
jgi:hypothetical protein